MTWDPQVPARERTAFGNFQMKGSHLKTGLTRVPFKDEYLSEKERKRQEWLRHQAALTVCDRAGDSGAARPLLEALGLIE